MAYQFDFFEPIPSEIELCEMQIKELKESQNRQCRSLHAKLGDLTKLVMKQQNEIDSLRTLLIKE